MRSTLAQVNRFLNSFNCCSQRKESSMKQYTNTLTKVYISEYIWYQTYNTLRTSNDVSTLRTSDDVNTLRTSDDVNTLRISDDVNTLRTSDDVNTPRTSGDINTPRTSGGDVNTRIPLYAWCFCLQTTTSACRPLASGAQVPTAATPTPRTASPTSGVLTARPTCRSAVGARFSTLPCIRATTPGRLLGANH